MTFTRHQPGDPPEQTSPATVARVAAALGASGYVTRTEAGAVHGRWDGYEMSITLEDGRVVIGGRWGRHVPEAMRAGLLVSLNDWHKGRWWPVAAAYEEDDGLTVRTRFVVEAAEGISNEQLIASLGAGLRATVDMLKFLGSPRGREDDRS